MVEKLLMITHSCEGRCYVNVIFREKVSQVQVQEIDRSVKLLLQGKLIVAISIVTVRKKFTKILQFPFPDAKYIINVSLVHKLINI